jgi:DNA-binding NarL/FixJ family response regulator
MPFKQSLQPVATRVAPIIETKQVTAVVADPHAVVREGLPLLLAREQISIVATVATAEGAEAVVRKHDPAVALIACDLPDMDGISLMQRLYGNGVRSAIVLYARDDDDEHTANAMRAGAAAVIPKSSAIADLAAALHAVAEGCAWHIGRSSKPRAGRAIDPTRDAVMPRITDTLSGAERRVLTLVAGGQSTEDTAATLHLSPHTVRTHLKNTMRKLGVSSRAHAVAIAIRESAIQFQ